jgi:hypothetical protein
VDSAETFAQADPPPEWVFEDLAGLHSAWRSALLSSKDGGLDIAHDVRYAVADVNAI